MRTQLRRRASAIIPSAAVLFLVVAGAPAGASAGTGDDRQPTPAPAAEEHADGNARFHSTDDHDGGTPEESRPSAAHESTQREGARSGTPTSSDDRPAPGADASQERRQDRNAASASNRGSVKVKAVGSDSFPPSHQPHLPCTFEIHLYGFAAGTADVRIDTHAPTGTGRVYTAEVTLADARGNQVSAVHGPIDLSADLIGSYEPHPQQGYHLKLYVDRRESTGGAKQKVFWVDCGDNADVGATATTTGDAGGDGGTSVEAGREATTGEAATLTVGEVLASGATAALGAAGEAAAGAETEQTGGVSPAGMLPRTGAGLLTLALVGAAAVAAGTALIRARRARPGA